MKNKSSIIIKQKLSQDTHGNNYINIINNKNIDNGNQMDVECDHLNENLLVSAKKSVHFNKKKNTFITTTSKESPLI